MAPEHTLLLPLDQFVFSELTTDGKEQRLHLVFATFEVTVRGICLRRIETALQRGELSLLAPVPEDQKPLIAEGHPMVLQITVSEAGSAATVSADRLG